MQSRQEKHIIHFTKSLKALKGILTDKAFRLKYCREEFSFGTKTISAAVHPMVCFSSYSPDELHKATITYGHYGISFRQAWASSKGIHEVLYLEKNSMPAKALRDLLRARQGKNGELPKALRLPVMQIKCFVKNARGKISKLENSEFDFRAEREWRFVPTKQQINGGMISQNQSYYNKNYIRLNDEMWKSRLSFELKDVLKVYVKDTAEIDELVNLSGLSRKVFLKSNWTFLPLQLKQTEPKT